MVPFVKKCYVQVNKYDIEPVKLEMQTCEIGNANSTYIF